MLQNILWNLMREKVMSACGFCCKPFPHIKEQKSTLSDPLKKGSQIRENGDEITGEKYKSFLFFSIPDTGTGTAIIILSGSGEDEI